MIQTVPRTAIPFVAGFALAAGLVFVALPGQAVTRPDDAPVIRTLAERLLSPLGLEWSARLHPLAVPVGFPVPIPPQARVLGSVERAAPAHELDGPALEVALDVPGAADEVLAAFARPLTADGWIQLSSGGSAEDRRALPAHATFCRDREWVEISVGEGSGGLRDVRIHLLPLREPCPPKAQP